MKLFKLSHQLNTFCNLPPEQFESTYESKILRSTLDSLYNMSVDLVAEFQIVILQNVGKNVDKWDIEKPMSLRCIYIVFDENGRIPQELLACPSDIVFHAYLDFDENKKEHRNLFHYPLGCNSFVDENAYVPVVQRKVNVFFSGNLHSGRKKLYQQLTLLKILPFFCLIRIQTLFKFRFDQKFPNSYLRFSDGFSKGLPFEEYATYLSNTKILLSPPGISNLECFRHYEGLRAGCIVIAEKLPLKPQYAGSPIIEVGKWSSGFKVIQKLIRDPEMLERLSQASYQWYQNYLSPQATAKYISKSIKSIPVAI